MKGFLGPESPAIPVKDFGFAEHHWKWTAGSKGHRFAARQEV
jgi:hypothetical protein